MAEVNDRLLTAHTALAALLTRLRPTLPDDDRVSREDQKAEGDETLPVSLTGVGERERPEEDDDDDDDDDVGSHPATGPPS